MSQQRKGLSILDVTIRDGSYPLKYQYTPAQVTAISRALDQAGIPFLEVSHGCGLGAGRLPGLEAAATDAEYVEAAKHAAKRAHIGVIARPEPITLRRDLDAVLERVDFIRFAANCDAPRAIEENAAHAHRRRPRLPLFLQLVSSTRRPTKDLLAAGRFAESFGFSVVYVVDTAGHMLPEEAAEIVSTLAAKLSIAVGFHGHDNLGLANANTLAAINAGATFVDASLKGIGRAGGNATLESLVSILHRRGLARTLSLDPLIDAGEELVAPLMPRSAGVSATDLRTADANIDLYPLELYERISGAGGIKLKELIRGLGRSRAVEIGPQEIVGALRKVGVDAQKVLAKAGIALPKNLGAGTKR